ncbi:MAG: hypothetical protein PWQ06_2616, partial [Anaerophaga sp.]|nr:hypothetical protein [Anaerophaga sp.]
SNNIDQFYRLAFFSNNLSVYGNCLLGKYTIQGEKQKKYK